MKVILETDKAQLNKSQSGLYSVKNKNTESIKWFGYDNISAKEYYNTIK